MRAIMLVFWTVFLAGNPAHAGHCSDLRNIDGKPQFDTLWMKKDAKFNHLRCDSCALLALGEIGYLRREPFPVFLRSITFRKIEFGDDLIPSTRYVADTSKDFCASVGNAHRPRRDEQTGIVCDINHPYL